MRKILLVTCLNYLCTTVCAQNLLLNPDAESLPRGTGWTIVSQGALTCEFAPTTNFLNWTMKPNGTANYPFDHTTGANGGTVFFAGCDSYFTGPFELYQVVDVSADAANIDFGGQLYTFGGYMQTPVSPQTDEGRFMVDYLNAGDVTLAGSYSSAWQSFSGGSGTAWRYYEDTRTAPVGTRKIKVRLQSKLYFNQTAVNVYFDDISLTRPMVVPVNLLGFSGKLVNGTSKLDWSFATEPTCSTMELQMAGASMNWQHLETFECNSKSYHYEHSWSTNHLATHYRLKINGVDGRISFSNIITIQAPGTVAVTLSPNPTKNKFAIAGLMEISNVRILSCSGQIIKTLYNISPASGIDVSAFAPGVYIIHINNNKGNAIRKLVIER